MKKNVVVKDLVLENRKMQDTFKKRLNEGFFDNVLKKVGMGEPEKVKEKKVSTMTPKEKELYDKAIAAAGTAAEDAAWAEYEAEKYGTGDKSPVLGKQETPMAQELQKKTVEELAKDMYLDFSKIKMRYDGTIDYDGEFTFHPTNSVDDKKNLLLPMRYVEAMRLHSSVKSDPFGEFKGFPKACGTFIVTDEYGSNPWIDSLGNKEAVKDAISKHVNVEKWSIQYTFKGQRDKEAGRSADYDDQMRR
jgi:hypothetical protein